MEETQPERAEGDGTVEVRRHEDGKFLIAVTTDGERQHIICGGFNVWRVFGLLALMLSIPLYRKVSKAIKLGD